MDFTKTRTAAAFCIFIGSAASAEPAITGVQLAFEPQAILEIVEELDAWLDGYSDLPRSSEPLHQIALIEPGSEVPYEGQMTHLDSTVRGVYDAETATIYLVRPWFGDTARDRSVLLHEMVHHRQSSAQHWYCPQAMEWDAYLLQEDYLNAYDQTGGFNWGWVVLASSCAVRDHHPD